VAYRQARSAELLCHAVSSQNIPEVQAMAPPRKKRRAPGEGHPIHLRLPADVFQRVEQRAKAQGRSFNRVIINELAAVPRLEQSDDLGGHVQRMAETLARYGARIVWHDLSDNLLNAVDEVLAAEGGALQAALDKLRVVRTGMLLHARSRGESGGRDGAPSIPV
jgi:hypothetical protein